MTDAATAREFTGRSADAGGWGSCAGALAAAAGCPTLVALAGRPLEVVEARGFSGDGWDFGAGEGGVVPVGASGSESSTSITMAVPTRIWRILAAGETTISAVPSPPLIRWTFRAREDPEPILPAPSNCR